MPKALILSNSPENCRQCELHKWDKQCGFECGVTGERIYNLNEILSSCPLVEIGNMELARAMGRVSEWLASGGDG